MSMRQNGEEKEVQGEGPLQRSLWPGRVLEEIEKDQCLLNWSRVGKIRVLCVRHPDPAVGLGGRTYPSALRPLNNKKWLLRHE